jgi:predicted transcriptional regulator of viral defense system
MTSNRGLVLLDKLAYEGRTGFTTAEVRADLQLSPQATSNLLSRLAAAGLVDRVAGGRYALRPIGSLGTSAVWDDLGSVVGAVFAGRPHRIGFLTALEQHGLLVRPVRRIQVASPYRPRLKALSGRPLQIVREGADKVLLGTEPLGPSRIATIERALLDTGSRPLLVGGASRLAEALAAVQSSSGLSDLATAVEEIPAYRRIGSISMTLSLPLAETLEPPPWRTLIELEPAAQRYGGWIDNAWGVAWPYPASELEAVTHQ